MSSPPSQKPDVDVLSDQLRAVVLDGPPEQARPSPPIDALPLCPSIDDDDDAHVPRTPSPSPAAASISPIMKMVAQDDEKVAKEQRPPQEQGNEADDESVAQEEDVAQDDVVTFDPTRPETYPPDLRAIIERASTPGPGNALGLNLKLASVPGRCEAEGFDESEDASETPYYHHVIVLENVTKPNTFYKLKREAVPERELEHIREWQRIDQDTPREHDFDKGVFVAAFSSTLNDLLFAPGGLHANSLQGSDEPGPFLRWWMNRNRGGVPIQQLAPMLAVKPFELVPEEYAAEYGDDYAADAKELRERDDQNSQERMRVAKKEFAADQTLNGLAYNLHPSVFVMDHVTWYACASPYVNSLSFERDKRGGRPYFIKTITLTLFPEKLQDWVRELRVQQSIMLAHMYHAQGQHNPDEARVRAIAQMLRARNDGATTAGKTAAQVAKEQEEGRAMFNQQQRRRKRPTKKRKRK